MKQKKKYLLIAMIGATLFSLLILVNISLYKTPDKLETVENITLIVDYNNSTIKIRANFTLTEGKTTAFDALNQWCEIQYDDFGWGIIVRVIDGVGGNWLYFINGIAPGVGSDMYSLKDGDLVKWARS
jgi:uncharacterized membrane protein